VCPAERLGQPPRIEVGAVVELAYGKAPGYWEIRESPGNGFLVVAPVPGTSESDLCATSRRVPTSSATRVVSPEEVSVRRGLLDGMRRNNGA
jgi:hypothetical protein